MTSLAAALGVILCLAGVMMLTLRPKANPLFGRILMALGALTIAAVLWHALGQSTFQRDR